MDRLLVVDDEPAVRQLVISLVERAGYAAVGAGNAEEALARLRGVEFALVLCDVNMPGMSGVDLVGRIQTAFPQTGVIMVTGEDDPTIAEAALSRGAYGYLIKPFRSSELAINVSNALRRRRLEMENRAYEAHLEETVHERTAALRRAIERLQESEGRLRASREETVRRLSTAVEFRDGETGRHIERMSRYCALLARKIGLENDRVEAIRVASPMHDLGKIAIPDLVLLKPGKHTPKEFEIMKSHAEMGHRLLQGSDSDLLELAATIALTHHERFDGTGYPRKLKGTAIPLEGRIVAIGDVFDALTSRRVYKPAYSLDQSIEILRAGRGSQFDPELLDAFLGSMEDVQPVFDRYRDP